MMKVECVVKAELVMELQPEMQEVMGVAWVEEGQVDTDIQRPASVLHVCRCTDYRVRNVQTAHQEHEKTSNNVASYLGDRSWPTPMSLFSTTTCGLFCMDIKYFSLSSNSVF